MNFDAAPTETVTAIATERARIIYNVVSCGGPVVDGRCSHCHETMPGRETCARKMVRGNEYKGS